MEARRGPSIIVVLLGAGIGLCLAVLAQQAGAWPLDRLAAFGLPAFVGAVALGLMIMRRGFARRAQDWIAIIIILVLLLFSLTGIGDAFGTDGDAQGYLNNCTLEATSTTDATNVNDSSRADPFDVDPAGEVTYAATAQSVITDHTWSLYVRIAGFSVPLADGEHPNSGESQQWGDTVDAGEQVETVENVVGELAGIFLVGGQVVGTGGSCDGQGWVRFPGGALGNLIGQLFLVILVLLVLVLLLILVRRGKPVVPAGAPAPDDGAPPPVGPADTSSGGPDAGVAALAGTIPPAPDAFEREPLGELPQGTPEQDAELAEAVNEAVERARREGLEDDG